MSEETLPMMFRTRAKEWPDLITQYKKESPGLFSARTYHELYDEIRLVAAGLFEFGVKRGDLIALISDNCQEWLAVDLGILSIGSWSTSFSTTKTP